MSGHPNLQSIGQTSTLTSVLPLSIHRPSKINSELTQLKPQSNKAFRH